MTTVRHLLVTFPAAVAAPAGDARLAGVVALLRRRARTPITVLTADAARTRAAHPDVGVRPVEELDLALRDCEALVVCGTACSEADFESMARQILTARILGVPAALVAVELATPGTARARAWFTEILANAESVSAADAATAARLQASRGRRVETVAPPELVLEPGAETRRGVIVDVALLAQPGITGLRAALQGLAPHGIRTLRMDAGAPGTWQAWWHSLSSASVLVTADPGAAAAALACGAVPVLCGGGDTAILSRIGLTGGTVQPQAGCDEWTAVLHAAQARAGNALATRVAPLRTLAWRALGPLADAARAAAWSAGATSAPTRALAAECCATLALQHIARGESLPASQLLEAYAAALGREPAWVRARARTAALLGQDREAVALLRQALEAAPVDAETHAELARAQLRTGDIGGARATWTEVARLVPADAAPWAELAALALRAGERDAALQCFSEALRRDPEHAGVRRAVAAYFVADPAGEAGFWTALPADLRRGPAVAALKAPAV